MPVLTLTFDRRPWGATVPLLSRAFWSDLRAKRAARQTWCSLSQLDDLILKDIGLDRTELASVAWGGGRDVTRHRP